MEENKFISLLSGLVKQKNEASNNYHLTLLMNYSIAEALLMKYIFQRKTKSISLLPLISSTTSLKEMTSLSEFLGNLTQDHPLIFFNDLLRDVDRILKENKNSISKYILRLETLLSWHFDTNFKNISNQPEVMNEYSVTSIHTVFQFIKVFEYQSITTAIDKEYLTLDEYFCSNKVYYYYLDLMKQEKINYGNMVDFLLSHLDTKVEQYKNNKINNCKFNNYQLEKYIIINFFLLKKIFIEYSFYISKDPEYNKIYQQIQKYTQYPIPIGILTEELLDIIYNEMIFQGVSIINQFRKEFFIDIIDSNLIEFDIKDFKKNIIIYSKEKEDYLHKFVLYLMKKNEKKKRKIVFREIIAKLYLTFLYNSNLDLNKDMIVNITHVLLKESDPNIIELSSKENIIKLLNVINQGCENEEEFNSQINTISNKLKSLKPKSQLKEKMCRNDYMPITQLRKYLKPTFNQFKCYDSKNKDFKERKTHFNLLKLYKEKFECLAKKYFKQLLQKTNDPIKDKKLHKLRINLLNQFKINIFLFEDQNLITDFLEDLKYSVNAKVSLKPTHHSDDKDFWLLFTDDIHTIKPNFIIYLLPHYDNCKENPFQSTIENELVSDPVNYNPIYLSEFIADNDAIYKSIVFMPYSSFENNLLSPNIANDDSINDIKYSIWKNQLDYYYTISNGLLNLDVYEISLLDTSYSKLLWGSCEIKGNQQANNQIIKLIFNCVDYLGLEVKEEKVERIITKPFQMKIINLFNRRHAPLNYNMTSNNGWLEVFLCEEKNDNEKYKSNANESNSNKYYEEFNYPQIDLETTYHNFKANEITIKSNIKLEINYDHNNVFDMDYNLINPKQKGELQRETIQKEFVIQIKHYRQNNENVTIPIATFTTF